MHDVADPVYQGPRIHPRRGRRRRRRHQRARAAALGDVVFAETPPIGKALKRGDPAAVVESVKAASDVFAPVSGEVIAVNSEVELTPGLINEDPLGRGWLFRLKLADPSIEALMDESAYADYLKTLG